MVELTVSDFMHCIAIYLFTFCLQHQVLIQMLNRRSLKVLLLIQVLWQKPVSELIYVSCMNNNDYYIVDTPTVSNAIEELTLTQSKKSVRSKKVPTRFKEAESSNKSLARSKDKDSEDPLVPSSSRSSVRTAITGDGNLNSDAADHSNDQEIREKVTSIYLLPLNQRKTIAASIFAEFGLMNPVVLFQEWKKSLNHLQNIQSSKLKNLPNSFANLFSSMKSVLQDLVESLDKAAWLSDSQTNVLNDLKDLEKMKKGKLIFLK